MATRKQKQELIDALKFTPIKARVSIGGYGGECYIGSVKREEYEVYKRGGVDMDQYAADWDDDGKWDDIPENLRIFPPGSPYDCDNLVHASGATMDDGSYITVEDEHGTTLWQSTLAIAGLIDQGVGVRAGGDVWTTDDLNDGDIVFWGGQGEKGCFFDGEFILKAPFDPKKLHISYSNADGWLLSSGVEYDGEDIEGYDGYNTTGKWSEYKFYIEGDEEVYAGVERDADAEDDDCDEEWNPAEELAKIEVPVLENEETWAQRAIDESMYSPWHAGDVKPVRKGVYEVEYTHGAWPWSANDRIEWTGRKWLHNRSEKTDIKQWRGLNQPAE